MAKPMNLKRRIKKAEKDHAVWATKFNQGKSMTRGQPIKPSKVHDTDRYDRLEAKEEADADIEEQFEEYDE